MPLFEYILSVSLLPLFRLIVILLVVMLLVIVPHRPVVFVVTVRCSLQLPVDQLSWLSSSLLVVIDLPPTIIGTLNNTNATAHKGIEGCSPGPRAQSSWNALTHSPIEYLCSCSHVHNKMIVSLCDERAIISSFGYDPTLSRDHNKRCYLLIIQKIFSRSSYVGVFGNGSGFHGTMYLASMSLCSM